MQQNCYKMRRFQGEGRRNHPDSSTAIFQFPENKTEVQTKASIYRCFHVIMNIQKAADFNHKQYCVSLSQEGTFPVRRICRMRSGWGRSSVLQSNITYGPIIQSGSHSSLLQVPRHCAPVCCLVPVQAHLCSLKTTLLSCFLLQTKPFPQCWPDSSYIQRERILLN